MTLPDSTLTTSEVAALLRIDARTVLSAAREGHLPAIHIGRVFRFPRAAIERMVTEGIPADATKEA